MKQTINNRLLLPGLLLILQLLSSNGVFAQNENIRTAFYGSWYFEKAELFERENIQGKSVLKKTITDLDEVRILNERIPYLPSAVSFHPDIVELVCPHNIYCGTYRMFELQNADEAFVHLMVGSPEEAGTDYYGRTLNAPGILYKAKRIGTDQISLTVEAGYMENGQAVHALVTCIFKKDK